MISKCPSCKKSHEHEDFLFEVACSCGIRYNPFMQTEGASPDFNVLEEAPREPSAPPGGFTESSQTFQELREFGESLGNPGVEPGGSPAAAAASPAPSRPAASSGTPAPLPGDMLVTSASTLTGYQIESYLPPISAAGDVDLGSESPLHAVFSALWRQAQAAGGNGVIALRWACSPDGSRVMATGTPIRCQRSGG